MLTVIAIFGVLICLGSIFGIIAPGRLLDVVRGVMNHSAGLYFAVGVRLALGIVLVLAAPASRFPLALQILGVITIIAALSIPFIGRARLMQLVEWFLGMPAAAVRGILVLGFAFGAFLIYATGLV